SRATRAQLAARLTPAQAANEISSSASDISGQYRRDPAASTRSASGGVREAFRADPLGDRERPLRRRRVARELAEVNPGLRGPDDASERVVGGDRGAEQCDPILDAALGGGKPAEQPL